MIEQATPTYCPLEKAFQIQRKTIDDKTKKQVKALKFLKLVKQKSAIKDIIPEHKSNEEAKNATENNNKTEQKVIRVDLVYKTNKYVYNFQQYETIQSFARNIFVDKSYFR